MRKTLHLDLLSRNKIMWGEKMIESAFLLLMNSLFFMLRISPGDSFPKPLSQEEERGYLERCANGDLEARNKLVEHNLRLVAHIMKKYYTQAEDIDDLISIGTIGLIKGINTYKADKGVKLATYVDRTLAHPPKRLENQGKVRTVFAAFSVNRLFYYESYCQIIMGAPSKSCTERPFAMSGNVFHGETHF